MTLESASWFAGEVIAINGAALAGYWIGQRGVRAWKWTATVATLLMLAWPAMRLAPTHVTHWLGVRPVLFTEVTGIVVPAVFLFTLAARNIRTRAQRRAVVILVPACCLFFIRNAAWMVRPSLEDLGPTHMREGVCLQSTEYTCVAASLVTLLASRGYSTSETEMARLSYTEPGWGTTDTRALGALRTRLAGEPLDICYEEMDYQRLMDVPKPCLVTVRWGYFVSHMVPVLFADPNSVVLGDPASGVMGRTRTEFERDWKPRGIYLIEQGRQRVCGPSLAAAPSRD